MYAAHCPCRNGCVALCLWQSLWHRSRRTYPTYTATYTRLIAPTPAPWSHARSTRGRVRSCRCWHTKKDAVAAIVASRHCEHKSEARAAGERVDVGALAWLMALARERGGIAPRVICQTSREACEPGQRRVPSNCDLLIPICQKNGCRCKTTATHVNLVLRFFDQARL